MFRLIITIIAQKRRSRNTYYLLLFTYYFPKNPAVLGKSEEVKGKK